MPPFFIAVRAGQLGAYHPICHNPPSQLARPPFISFWASQPLAISSAIIHSSSVDPPLLAPSANQGLYLVVIETSVYNAGMSQPPYNPKKHRRKSIRLHGWDYGQAGAYFITICAYQKQCLFNNETYRKIAEQTWLKLANTPKSSHFQQDEWILMPNHFHAIVIINEDSVSNLDGRKAGADDYLPAFQNVSSGKLGSLVATYKGLVTRQINQIRQTPGGRVWHRGYWDRIVRNERELNAIRKYIQENPVRWKNDRDNFDQLVKNMSRHP